MAIQLYDASVAPFLQMLVGVTGFLERGREFCVAGGLDPDEVLAIRLHADMLPFSFQVHSIIHHSVGAIDGVKAGSFSPPPPLPELDYAGWQARVAESRRTLESLSREEVEALQGRDVVFCLGDKRIPFIAEHFLLSFSLPNFYFHITTAYDILRMKGVPLGKRDYLAQMRIKR